MLNRIWRASRRGRGGLFDLVAGVGWVNALLSTLWEFPSNFPFSADQGSCRDRKTRPSRASCFRVFPIYLSPSHAPSCPPHTAPPTFRGGSIRFSGSPWWESRINPKPHQPFGDPNTTLFLTVPFVLCTILSYLPPQTPLRFQNFISDRIPEGRIPIYEALPSKQIPPV
jgi:hypothetical protein